MAPDSDETTTLLQSAEEFGEDMEKRASRFWDRFSEFAIRDNVLEVAVGLIIAAAFTTVVTSFMTDILLPPLSLLPFLNKQLDEKFLVLRSGSHFTHNSTSIAPDNSTSVVLVTGYNTLKQALDDGAVVWAWGHFLDELISFMGVGVTLFAIATAYGRLTKDSIIHETVRCRYCRKWISIKAKRCINCTSWQEGREG